MRRCALVLLLLTACGSEAKKVAPSAPPTTSAEADAAAIAPTVFLRSRIEGEHARIDVVARDVSEVHGIAFRLAWDAAKLGYAETRPSGTWSDRALALAKEGVPGELVVTWSERGSVPGHPALEETILGTITLTARAPEADIAFRPERSTVHDSTGRAAPVEWQGTLVRK